MLSPSTRHQFHTLLDALTWQQVDDQPAIIWVETDKPPITITRRGLKTAVFHHATALQQQGIQPGDLILIAHAHPLPTIFDFWAALHIGAIPAIFPTLTEKLDPTVYARNMAELVRRSGVKLVVGSEQYSVLSKQYSVDSELPPTISNLQSPIPVSSHVSRFTFYASSTAFLQHSSGTTGLQKGVALSHSAVLNQLASYSQAIGLNEQDVVVSWLPLYHDMGLIAGFLLPLVQGIPLVLMSPFDWVQHPALLLRAIHEHQSTLCWLPNFAYNHCARRIRQRDTDGLSLASMRLFINCSEPVRHDSHQLFLQRFATNGVKPEMLGVSYAMAENTFAVTQTAPGAPARLDVVDGFELAQNLVAAPVSADSPRALTQVSCGQPIPGTRLQIVDGQTPLPERHVGEIVIQSDCMLTGYYKRDDLRPFANGWYFTGDRGYLADGELYVIGRSKDLIISAGKNIYPQDIEAIVNDVPGVHPGRVVAFGVPDPREGTELIAVIAETGSQDIDERREIGRAIRQAVAHHSSITVTYVEVVEPRWLLKTSSGKIARAANRDKWLQTRPSL